MEFQYSLDVVIVDKKTRTCKIIEYAVPGDSRIEDKEKEKIEKYQNLQKRIIEDLECESKDYTISCEFFRCYT